MAELEEPMATSLQHKLAPEVGSLRLPPTQHGTNRFLPGFLSKAACFLAFAVLLATFPSQAPEFVNQNLLTSSWELLRLLLVGIAVSYGLFSRRNAGPAAEKEELHRPDDTPRSYVSELLQVSSVFGNDDDEEEEEARPWADYGKPQVWSSQYSRAEPAVVLAQGSSINGGGGGVDRPLLLPVRSLRSRIPDEESPDENGRPEHVVGLPKTTPPPPREGLGALPSPIPWRSLSGRMEVREERGAAVPPPCSLPPPATDSDISSLSSSSFRSSPSSRSSSAAASPRWLSPSPELRAKTGEDSGKKKTFYKPPPPPPPPPPPFGRRPPHPNRMSFKDDLMGFDPKPRFPAEGYSPGRSVRAALSTTEAAQGVTRSRSSSSAAVAAAAATPPSPAYEYQNGEEEARKKKKNKDVLEEAVAVETEDDSDSDDASELGEPAATDENEVDKKADAFIAKFREQIRLQRIESIRRSAGQRSPRTTK